MMELLECSPAPMEGLELGLGEEDWSSVVVKEEELAAWSDPSPTPSPTLSFKQEEETDTLFALFQDLDLPDPIDGGIPNWLEQQTEIPSLEYSSESKVAVTSWLEGGEAFCGAPPLLGPSAVLAPSPPSPPTPQPSPHQAEKLQNALLEFEMVLCNALTPPESPNSAAEHNIFSSLMQDFSSNELDEWIGERVEEMAAPPAVEEAKPSWSGELSGGCAAPPPLTVSPPPSGYETSFGGGSCYSPRSSSGAEGGSSSGAEGGSSCGEDPDWSPSPEPESRPRPGPVKRGGRRGPGSGPEEKRMRKKEQNRDAATRYRLKKKMEAEGMADEEKELRKTNEELKAKRLELAKELKYLKSLMRDVYRAKGLLKK